MSTNQLLVIALVIYLIAMLIAYVFKLKWLYGIGGILWFIPMTTVDNLLIITFSVVMVIVHFVLAFFMNEREEY